MASKCPRCRSDSVIKYGSYREYQRYLCKDCDRTFNDKTGTIFAHAKIGLDTLLFAFYSFLRFNTSIHQLAAETDVSYRMLHRCVEQFARTLDAPVVSLVGPVEIDEFYVSAGKKGRKRDQEPRSRGLSKRGRGTYDEDKPPVFTLVDRGSDPAIHRPCEIRNRIDCATPPPPTRRLVANRLHGRISYDPIEDDEDFHRICSVERKKATVLNW